MDNYKKLSLLVILDAYVTKNAINDFLYSKDHREFRLNLIDKMTNPEKAMTKINNHINYLTQELKDIEEFLDDSENIHWATLGLKRELFDKNLPNYKRRIEWFRSVDRYPFDYSIFFSNNSENSYF